MRVREIVIDRTCARCGCEYEWGVHVAFFAEGVGLTDHQIGSLTHGTASDPCWTTERERLLIRLVDALHEDGDIGDPLWASLAAEFDDGQLLDLTMLCGWYHAISFTARSAGLPRSREPRPSTRSDPRERRRRRGPESVLQPGAFLGQEGERVVHPGDVALIDQALVRLVSLGGPPDHDGAVVADPGHDVVDEPGTITQL